MVCSLTIMMFARMDHLIVRDGCLLFFDKVDAFVPESARPVRVYVEVAGNVWGDHHRLWLVAVEKCLQEINIMHHFVSFVNPTCKYCRCSSKMMILFHLSDFNRIDLRVYSWMNSTLRSLSPILVKKSWETVIIE